MRRYIAELAESLAFLPPSVDDITIRIEGRGDGFAAALAAFATEENVKHRTPLHPQAAPIDAKPDYCQAVHRLRLSLGLSQSQFAQFLDVPYPTAQKWMKGSNWPGYPHLRDMQAAARDAGLGGNLLEGSMGRAFSVALASDSTLLTVTRTGLAVLQELASHREH